MRTKAEWSTTALKPRHPGELAMVALRDPLSLIGRMDAVGGDVVHARPGRRTVYLLRTPALVRALLSYTGDDLVKERALRLSRVILGNGLLTSEGALHRRQRRLVMPAFDQQRVARYSATVATMAEHWSSRQDDTGTMDLHREMARLSLGIAARTLLGADVDDTASFRDAVDTATAAFHRHRNPFAEVFDRLPLPGTIRLMSSRRRIHEAVDRLTIAARAHGGSDLLGRLDSANDRAQLRDELVTLLLSGHETTAVALTWTWYLLSMHPAIVERLHGELDRVIGSRPLGADDLPDLVYTRQVVAEAMRLYPPVWAVSREATADVTIADHTFPRGSTVIFSQYYLHRDGRWWPDPDRFDPDRFEPDRVIEPFTYVPFSSGARGCIGERLAWSEIVLVIAAIARRWHVDVDGPTRIGLEAGISLRPDRRLLFRLRRRCS